MVVDNGDVPCYDPITEDVGNSVVDTAIVLDRDHNLIQRDSSKGEKSY